MKRILSGLLAISVLLAMLLPTYADASVVSDYDSVVFDPYSVDWFWPAFRINANTLERMDPVVNIYSEFGAWRWVNKWDLHQGIDISPVLDGSTYGVFATRKGIVIKSGYDSESMGNYVTIYHGIDVNTRKPVSSTYMHMAYASGLKRGDEVNAGDFIGYVGGTPFYGVHLHFHIIYSKESASVPRSRDKNDTNNYLLNNYINTNPSKSDLLDGRFDDSNNMRIDSGKTDQELCTSGKLNYVFNTHTCPPIGKNAEGKYNYETYKGGGKTVLGACKECHKPYDWQSTFQETGTTVYEIKKANRNDKVPIRTAPYEDAKQCSTGATKTLTVVGKVTNAYGNEWYAVDYTDDAQKACYIAYVYCPNVDGKYDFKSKTKTIVAPKLYAANTTEIEHTHNYDFDNGMCYCGAKKTTTQTTNEASTLSINLTQYPVQHVQGNNFGLRGTISSNYKVKKIYGYIKQNGTAIQSTEDTPNAKTVDIQKQNLNNNLLFNRLSAGNYTLEVQAIDASGNTIRISKDFSVIGETVKAESTLSISLEKYPVTLNEGSGFGLRGSVASNYAISIVKGSVFNSAGQTVLSSQDKPKSTKLDIRSANLNNDLIFNRLPAGEYTLKVSATDASGKTVEVSKQFSVVSQRKDKDSTLAINLEKYPVTLNVGSSYGLRGSITSNYNISAVWGYVINANGQTVLSSQDTPNATYMDIRPAHLNNDLVFNWLSAGNYTMRVVAVDASGRSVEATKSFVVKNKDTYVDSTPKGTGVSGTVDIPSSWDNLSIRSGPSTDYQIVGSMNQGARCTVYPDKAVNGWYYVNYNGVYGYAAGNRISISSSSGGAQAENTRTGVVQIPSSWDNLSIRSGPSTDYQIVGSMNQGARCTVYPDKAVNGWYYVYYNGVYGYAAGNRITLQ